MTLDRGRVPWARLPPVDECCVGEAIHLVGGPVWDHFDLDRPVIEHLHEKDSERSALVVPGPDAGIPVLERLSVLAGESRQGRGHSTMSAHGEMVRPLASLRAGELTMSG